MRTKLINSKLLKRISPFQISATLKINRSVLLRTDVTDVKLHDREREWHMERQFHNRKITLYITEPAEST
jgi:hypothetical protein